MTVIIEHRRAGWIVAATGLALGAALAVSGCASGESNKQSSNPDSVDGPDAAIAQQLQSDAADIERLRSDMVRQTGAHIDTGGNPRLQQARPGPTARIEPLPAAANVGEMDNAKAASRLAGTNPGGGPGAEPAPTLDQNIARLSAELGARLGERADRGERPLADLLAVASLEFAAPGAAPAASSAEAKLSGHEIDVISAWRDAVRQATAELSSAGGASSDEAAEAVRRALEGAAERVGSSAPLSISKAALCTKVDGFGRYTEFPGKSVLAGRKQRAIVYVELGRFGRRPTTGPDGDSGFSVELTQDLSLYHEADSLLAWRKPEQEISDFSRNKRRDFFIVQMIDLPETLTIGKYTLKIRVRDKTNGAECEASLPLEVVAQGSLVGK